MLELLVLVLPERTVVELTDCFTLECLEVFGWEVQTLATAVTG